MPSTATCLRRMTGASYTSAQCQQMCGVMCNSTTSTCDVCTSTCTSSCQSHGTCIICPLLDVLLSHTSAQHITLTWVSTSTQPIHDVDVRVEHDMAEDVMEEATWSPVQPMLIGVSVHTHIHSHKAHSHAHTHTHTHVRKALQHHVYHA